MEMKRISRDLADGWQHYDPVWRMRVASQAIAHPETTSIANESDPIVRQLYRFLLTGICVASAAFAFAISTERSRASCTAAGLINSMTVAGYSVEEIAHRLGTTSLNVYVYRQVFFDVARFLHHREWLATIACPGTAVNRNDPIALKERMSLAAAFHRGRQGLEQILTGSAPASARELKDLAASIKAAVTMRAYHFTIERTQQPLSADDLRYYLELQKIQAAEDDSNQQTKLAEFGQAFRQLVMEKQEEADRKRLVDVVATTLDAEDAHSLS